MNYLIFNCGCKWILFGIVELKYYYVVLDLVSNVFFFCYVMTFDTFKCSLIFNIMNL